MKPFGRPSLPTRTAGSLRQLRGFTLFEVGLALLCLMLLGYIAAAEIRKLQHRAQRDHFITELRSLASIFETYRAQKGEWPAATNAEIRVPRGMESVLAGTRWLAGPPFGGSYDWVPPARSKPDDDDAVEKPRPSGMIAITAFSPNPPLPLTFADLHAIDAKLDDGNLRTGHFKTGFNGWPVYLVPAGR
jgi:type II secretory pathway pseudopilin PulG